VVVKDVPAGATMVGVPAHSVEAKIAPTVPHFDAYGTGSDEEDPMQKTIDMLTTKLDELQKRLDAMEGESSDSIKTAQRWEGK
jgi:hypothetical protein